MEGHLQCAEQQESSSNFSKYCACHAKWISWLIRITYEKSFTMREATRVILQLHQILRLPRKMNLMIDRAHIYGRSFTMRGATRVILQLQQILRRARKMNLMIDPHHIWNVIYNARSNKSHPPTSPNTAPATQNESHDWSASHMKHHLQCAEQQESSSNFTKYCACHAKWISWLIRITYETSFTMRGATSVILQPHQILRLPRKMNLMLNSLHTWNAIYNAWSNICHPPTSPNTAPATKNDLPKSETNLLKTAEVSFPMRDRSENDPRMIREWSDHDPTMKTQTATRRAAEVTFRARQKQILLKITTFPGPAIIPHFTKCCACHKKWHMNFTKCCAWHKKVTHELHQMLRLPQKVTHELHQMLHLP